MWLLFPTAALAAGGTLTLNYAYNDVQFDLYRVAESKSNGYVLVAPFDQCPVVLPDTADSSAWKDAATTLAGYAATEQPTVSQSTADHKAVFRELKAGVYLVVGAQHAQNGYTYTPTVFLIKISEGENARADVKHDQSGNGGDGGDESYASYTVTKVWKGDQAEKRPEKVTIQLFRGETLQESVTLDDSNQWSYTWKHLNTAYRWQVVEADVPAGYTVSVSQTGTNFYVTNTASADVPDKPGKPGDSGETGKTDPTNPSDQPGPLGPTDESVNPSDQADGNAETNHQSGDSEETSGPKLPQTGQLWWPVAVMAGIGSVLFGIGRIKSRRDELKK